MNSSYTEISSGPIHYLHDGTGPPIFLLHASPMSAHSLVPLINALSSSHTVIAIDTPGYGHSAAPARKPSHISTYSQLIHELQVRLGLSTIAIYGTATGAQIGIKYALDYPDDVAYLFLDNSAHFTEKEKKGIYASYFPDLATTEDGSHLRETWHIVDNLFQYFPWCFQEEKYKLSTPKPPIHILHRVAIDYIKSGANYDWAYRAAFAYEDRERIYELKVPTHIFRWEASILKSYTDRIFEKALPHEVDFSIVSAQGDRNTEMAQTIRSRYSGPQTNLALLDTQHVTTDHIEVPKRSFPTPEATGHYLMDAWNSLDQDHNTNNLDKKNRAFVKWAETIL